MDDSRIPDNSWFQLVDKAIVAEAPVAAMKQAGIPAAVSNSAGAFVCICLLYGRIHYLAEHGGETIVKGLEVVLAAAESVESKIKQTDWLDDLLI